MPTITLQHYKRGSHYYASIIETFRVEIIRSVDTIILIVDT